MVDWAGGRIPPPASGAASFVKGATNGPPWFSSGTDKGSGVAFARLASASTDVGVTLAMIWAMDAVTAPTIGVLPVRVWSTGAVAVTRAWATCAEAVTRIWFKGAVAKAIVWAIGAEAVTSV